MQAYKQIAKQVLYLLLFQWGLMHLMQFVFFVKQYTIGDFSLDWIWLSMRYIWAALAYYYAIFYLVFALPVSFRTQVWFRGLQIGIYLCSTLIWLALAGIDLEYIQFTGNRLNFLFIDYLRTSNEGYGQVPSLMVHYSWIVLLVIGLLGLSAWHYKKVVQPVDLPIFFSKYTAQAFLFYTLGMGLLFTASRGGLQFKPMNIMEAYAVKNPHHVNLVLNSPYTFIRTYGKTALIPKNIADDPLFFVKKSTRNRTKFTPKNVVVIILESFSYDYFDTLNFKQSNTPFLDSLMQHSIVFDSTYANGHRSIEALPAILSSLPGLMPSDFISSIYSSNRIESLASHLGTKGYRSTFFHGGRNGTMSFNSYISAAGFNAYYGMNEYIGPPAFDGQWGVYDHAFLDFWGQTLKKEKEPFLSCFFTLSAHHPYTLPKEFEDDFIKPEEEVKILKTIRYTDWALRTFFNQIKKEPWFKNTLFVFTADHCATGTMRVSDDYNNYNYRIPFFLYDAHKPVHQRVLRIAGQHDILPTVLSYLNYNKPYFATGNHVLDTNNRAFSVHFSNGANEFYYKGTKLRYVEQEDDFVLDAAYALQGDTLVDTHRFSQEEQQYFNVYLKRYTNAMIQNKLTVP